MDPSTDIQPNETTQAPSAKKARRGLPIWVYGVAFAILIAFLVFIGKSLVASMEGPIAIGQPVSQFTLTTFDGQQIDTADLSGKVIVINFWASWCKPCEQEAADIEEAWQNYKAGGKVIFLGVNYVDVEPQALEYLEKFNITYPNGPDLGTRISQKFRVHAVPETYIIDKDGKLAYVQPGIFYSTADLLSVIDGLLK